MITLDFIGLFIFIAGFIIGLGAVTVIDIHGFLGRKSGLARTVLAIASGNLLQ